MPYLKSDAIGVSRFLSWPSAVALGAGLSLAIQLTLVETLVQSAGPWTYVLAWVFYSPLFLAWLELPGEHGPSEWVWSAGYPRLAFIVAWIELGGICALAALLAKGVAMGLAVAGERLWQLNLSSSDLLALVIGTVAINELIGTRAHSRAASALVTAAAAVLAVLLVSSFFEPTFAVDQKLATPLGSHQLFSPALLASVLWGPYLVLSRRRLIRRRPRGALLPMAVLWLALPLIGVVGWWIGSVHPEMTPSGIATVDPGSQRLSLLALVVGVALCLLGLSQVLASGIRVVSSMTFNGLAPKSLTARRSERGVALAPLGLLVVAAWALARWVDLQGLANGVALAVLWLSSMAFWPHIRTRAKDRLPGSLTLPLHPLIPALVSAGCLFLSMVLPKANLGVGLAWLILGGVYFVVFGRRELALSDLQKHLVGRLPEEDEEPRDRVLVAVGEGLNVTSLLKVGAGLAASRNAELLVLRIELLIEQLTWNEARILAQGTLDQLEKTVSEAGLPPDLPVHPLVRLAPSVADGILDAVSEVEASFLILGWPEAFGSSDIEPVVEKVFAATSSAIAVVRGALPAKAERVLVASAGGPHAATALELAEAISTVAGVSVTGVSVAGAPVDGGPETGSLKTSILNVLTPNPSIAKGHEAVLQTHAKRLAQRTKSAVEGPAETSSDPDQLLAESSDRIGEILVEAATVAGGVEREVGPRDLLLLGASVDRLLGQSRWGGFPVELASERSGLTIVVREKENAPRFWRRRLWEWLSNPLPALTDEQRIRVQLAMRKAARADIDFYILISLASAIATLGLMQSSAAVVIGAMLVAPLMSPILGMGHAIVRGHLRLVRRAASSTIKGVGIAIAVGSVFPLIFSGISPTPEILARGAPSLLDLAVALASGAAAAYAVSRPSVAAALPGVAIAAALVPPLCVVGFGLGASELSLAGGALLLFVTNLCAIVLSAALVFLMMGFRPRVEDRGGAVWKSLAFAGVGLLMVSIPLSFQTLEIVRTSQAKRHVMQGLAQVESDLFRISEVRFDHRKDVLWVRVAIHSFVEDVPLSAFAEVQRQTALRVDKDIRFDLSVSRAQRFTLEGRGAVERDGEHEL